MDEKIEVRSDDAEYFNEYFMQDSMRYKNIEKGW